ncbi:MAG: C39 family peptidase [Anaerolineae bacterium]|nr:C39 family peptidase [Anaerolineae bacterium]
MLAKPLDVPYYPQLDDGYCLPACVQMVLSYIGLPVKQRPLARDLGVRPPLDWSELDYIYALITIRSEHDV